MMMLIDVHNYLILLNHRLSLLTTAYVMLLLTEYFLTFKLFSELNVASQGCSECICSHIPEITRINNIHSYL